MYLCYVKMCFFFIILPDIFQRNQITFINSIRYKQLKCNINFFFRKKFLFLIFLIIIIHFILHSDFFIILYIKNFFMIVFFTWLLGDGGTLYPGMISPKIKNCISCSLAFWTKILAKKIFAWIYSRFARVFQKILWNYPIQTKFSESNLTVCWFQT